MIKYDNDRKSSIKRWDYVRRNMRAAADQTLGFVPE